MKGVSMTEETVIPPGVDPAIPSPARIYDYVLGGTHNFASDRAAAERIREMTPDLADAAWVNRGFHQRAARWLAAERGIGQFIDIGSGLPTMGNTHTAVQKERPGARVVYVDIDPMVQAYASELLAADGTTAVVTADLCDPDRVLGDPALRGLIDFGRPVGLLITAVLHFVPDEADPWEKVGRYCAALAPGSYLVLSHVTHERLPPRPRGVCERHPRCLPALPRRGGAVLRRPGDRAALSGRRAGDHPHRPVGRGRPGTCRQRGLAVVVRSGRAGAVSVTAEDPRPAGSGSSCACRTGSPR